MGTQVSGREKETLILQLNFVATMTIKSYLAISGLEDFRYSIPIPVFN